jgi:hypothetical protein
MADNKKLPGTAPGLLPALPDQNAADEAVPGTGARVPGAAETVTSDGVAADVPEPVYTAVEDWVTGYFLPMFRRALGGEFRWCASWWQHGEAISRLTALWHAWEVLRHQPGTGIATWYRDHLDHQLPILMGARGPFCQCSETAHREPRQAAAVPAPGDWWDTADGDYSERSSLAAWPAADGEEPGAEPGPGAGHDVT